MHDVNAKIEKEVGRRFRDLDQGLVKKMGEFVSSFTHPEAYLEHWGVPENDIKAHYELSASPESNRRITGLAQRCIKLDDEIEIWFFSENLQDLGRTIMTALSLAGINLREFHKFTQKENGSFVVISCRFGYQSAIDTCGNWITFEKNLRSQIQRAINRLDDSRVVTMAFDLVDTKATVECIAKPICTDDLGIDTISSFSCDREWSKLQEMGLSRKFSNLVRNTEPLDEAQVLEMNRLLSDAIRSKVVRILLNSESPRSMTELFHEIEPDQTYSSFTRQISQLRDSGLIIERLECATTRAERPCEIDRGLYVRYASTLLARGVGVSRGPKNEIAKPEL